MKSDEIEILTGNKYNGMTLLNLKRINNMFLIDEAVKKACEEPTLVDALSWICVWESERAIDQARNRFGTGANGAGWDTCFTVCIQLVMDRWNILKGNSERIQKADHINNTLNQFRETVGVLHNHFPSKSLQNITDEINLSINYVNDLK